MTETCSTGTKILNVSIWLLPVVTSTFMDYHLSFGINERTSLCLNCYVFAWMHVKIDMQVFWPAYFPVFIGNVWNPIIINVIFC